jgi:hypothetical protein
LSKIYWRIVSRSFQDQSMSKSGGLLRLTFRSAQNTIQFDRADGSDADNNTILLAPLPRPTCRKPLTDAVLNNIPGNQEITANSGWSMTFSSFSTLALACSYHSVLLTILRKPDSSKAAYRFPTPE